MFFIFSLTTGEYTREVEIGEFMDILCPHKGLVGITTGSKLLEFDIYNVTQDLYEKCHTGGEFTWFLYHYDVIITSGVNQVVLVV